MSLAAVQFAVVPNFTRLSFSDEEAVSAALYHVLESRNQEDSGDILSTVTQETNCQTIGDLRKLTDQEWKELKVPAMCRIYLKYAVRQSGRKKKSGSFMEKLQDDFNYGQPFDMSLYQNHLAMLAQMGFNTEVAMEALVITENKGIEGALEILFQNSDTVRATRRQEAMERLNRRVRVADEEKGDAKMRTALVNLRAQMLSDKKSRELLEDEMRKLRQQGRNDRYKDFLRGLCASESISIQAFESYQKIRKELKITEEEHDVLLGQTGVTAEQFESYRQFEKKDKRDAECVVCLDNPKDHVCMPCMHMCLCEECAVDFSSPKAKCPMCSKKVKRVQRIFM